MSEKLTPQEDAQLQLFVKDTDNPDEPFFQLHKGKKLSAVQIEQEIRSGSEDGRKLMSFLMELDLSKE